MTFSAQRSSTASVCQPALDRAVIKLAAARSLPAFLMRTPPSMKTAGMVLVVLDWTSASARRLESRPLVCLVGGRLGPGRGLPVVPRLGKWQRRRERHHQQARELPGIGHVQAPQLLQLAIVLRAGRQLHARLLEP